MKRSEGTSVLRAGRLIGVVLLQLVLGCALFACVEDVKIPAEREGWTVIQYQEEAQRLRQLGEYDFESAILAEGVRRYDDGYLSTKLGMVYWRLGKRQKAADQIQKAIEVERRAGQHDVGELERIKREILTESKALMGEDELFFSELLSGTAVEVGAMVVGIVFVTIWGFIINHWFSRRHYRQLRKYTASDDWDGIAHILICEYKKENHDGLVRCLEYLYERHSLQDLVEKIKVNVANKNHEEGIIICLEHKVVGIARD